MRSPGDDRYILVGQTPVRCPDLLTWGRWFETEDRQVARTIVMGVLVSTVFLGLDHRFFGDGPPILFESMAFWPGEGGEEQVRCATWSQAERQHQTMCRYVALPRVRMSHFFASLRQWWSDAACDWRRLWRDLRGIEAPAWERLAGQIDIGGGWE